MYTLLKEDVQSSSGSLRKLSIKDRSLSKSVISNIYRKGLVEIPPISDCHYGRRLSKLLRRTRRSRKVSKRVRFFKDV